MLECFEMESYNFFLNKSGRLRSGWRLGIFVVTFAVLAKLIEVALVVSIMLAFKWPADQVLGGYAGFFAQAFILFTAAILAGWACGALLEELPLRALGWTTHKGWRRDFLLGTAIGFVSLALATLLGIIGGGFHFTLNSSATASAMAKTLLF